MGASQAGRLSWRAPGVEKTVGFVEACEGGGQMRGGSLPVSFAGRYLYWKRRCFREGRALLRPTNSPQPVDFSMLLAVGRGESAAANQNTRSAERWITRLASR